MIRIFLLTKINPYFVDASSGPLSQSVTYKAQALKINSNNTFLERSHSAVKVHGNHPIAYGIFLSHTYNILGHETIVSVLCSTILSILCFFIIYVSLNSNQKSNSSKDSKVKIKVKNSIISSLFILNPLVIINSSFTSPEFFATIFLITFYLFLRKFKWNKSKHSSIDNHAIILFLLSICALLINIKIEYGTTSIAFGLILLIVLIKSKNTKYLKTFFLGCIGVILLNLHIIWNIIYENKNNAQFSLFHIIPNIFAMINEDIYYFLLLIIIYFFILLSLKKTKSKLSFLDFILTSTFYLSASCYKVLDLRYNYIILVSIIIPLIFARNIKLVSKVILLLLIAILIPKSNINYLYQPQDEFYSMKIVNVIIKDLNYTNDQIFIFPTLYRNTEAIFDNINLSFIEYHSDKLENPKRNLKNKIIIDFKFMENEKNLKILEKECEQIEVEVSEIDKYHISFNNRENSFIC